MSYNKLVEKLLDFRSSTGEAKDSGQPSLDTAADDGDVAEIDSSQPAEPTDVVTTTEPENTESGEEVTVEGGRDSTASPGPSGGDPSSPVEGNDQGI